MHIIYNVMYAYIIYYISHIYNVMYVYVACTFNAFTCLCQLRVLPFSLGVSKQTLFQGKLLDLEKLLLSPLCDFPPDIQPSSSPSLLSIVLRACPSHAPLMGFLLSSAWFSKHSRLSFLHSNGSGTWCGAWHPAETLSTSVG